MKRLTILALHLGYGGIEKTISSLAQNIHNMYEVKIICVYQLYNKPPFEIPDNVKIVYLLNKKDVPNREALKQALKDKKLFSFIKEVIKALKILYLKQYKMIKYVKKENSDIIISTREIHNKILSRYGAKEALKIGWEHNHHNFNEKYISKVVKSIKKLDYFVLVTDSLCDFYQQRTQTPCITIPNMLDTIPNSDNQLTGTNNISVGRLSPEKGFEDLISVAQILKQKTDFHLHIVGDGSEKLKLETQIRTLNLEENITLHGFQEKPYIETLMEQMALYVMPSHTEAFGIVLIEAFSHRLPCIAFDSAAGACELIDEGINGYLIKHRNIKHMAQQISELLENDDERERLGNNAYQKSFLYTSDNIMKAWFELFESK